MTNSPTLDDLQHAGFPMGGEPLVAVDLADTLMTAQEPVVDLLATPDRLSTWWRLQRARLPEAPEPTEAMIQRLRAAVRDVLDAHLEHRPPQQASISDLNAAAAAVPTSPQLSWDGKTPGEASTRWHTEQGGNAALSALARQTIELLSSPAQLERLRRCANPSCSMLFLAETKRRQWCTANICGNRARVARHYRRTHETE